MCVNVLKLKLFLVIKKLVNVALQIEQRRHICLMKLFHIHIVLIISMRPNDILKH